MTKLKKEKKGDQANKKKIVTKLKIKLQPNKQTKSCDQTPKLKFCLTKLQKKIVTKLKKNNVTELKNMRPNFKKIVTKLRKRKKLGKNFEKNCDKTRKKEKIVTKLQPKKNCD